MKLHRVSADEIVAPIGAQSTQGAKGTGARSGRAAAQSYCHDYATGHEPRGLGASSGTVDDESEAAWLHTIDMRGVRYKCSKFGVQKMWIHSAKTI